MGPKIAEVLWNVGDSEVPKSFLGLLKMYSDKTATSLKFNALAAYLVHAV